MGSKSMSNESLAQRKGVTARPGRNGECATVAKRERSRTRADRFGGLKEGRVDADRLVFRL